MSDVTGNLGSESIRLRGMALEETQYQILRTLESMSKGGGLGVGKVEAALGGLTGQINATTSAMSNSKGPLAKVGGAFVAVAKKFEGTGKVVGETLDNLGRTIRGFDSNVRDSSFAMRQLAVGTSGATQRIFKFAAESVSQLEEQFDVYKRLSNVGGTVAGDFDNLRINAANMGITMQEYTGLLESNFLNLRLGGQSTYRAMKQLGVETAKMRDASSGVNEDFMRLGIGASDYGQVIAQNAMLFGGLKKTQEEYGSNFAKKMLDTTRSVTALSDAFGFNREQVMKAANDAMKDARNRTIFNSIKDEGKRQMLAAMTGLFGGDAQKGMEATIAAYTGRVSESVAPLMSIAPDLLPAMKQFSAGLNELGDGVKDPKQVEALLQRSGLEGIAKRIGVKALDLANATLGQSGAFADGTSALITFSEQFGSVKDAVQNVTEKYAQQGSESDKTLQALGDVQRRNIEMATSFAATNKMLNKFGITVAMTTQILTKLIGKTSETLLKPLSDTADLFDLTGMSKNASDEMAKAIDEAAPKVAEQLAKIPDKIADATGKPRPTSPARTEGNVVGGERTVSVQGTQVPINNLDTSGKEAVAGGRTSLGIKQLVSAIAATRKINVTGTNDAYHVNENLGGKHPKGLGVDFTVAGGANEAEKTLTELDAIMGKAGLKKGVDYDYLNEYKVKSVGKTGDHLHVQFNSGEAADKFYEAVAKNPAIIGQSNPVSSAPVLPPKPAPKPDLPMPSLAPSTNSNPSTKVSVNSNSSTQQINTSNGYVVSLNDETIEKLSEKINSGNKDLTNEFSRLREDLSRKIA